MLCSENGLWGQICHRHAGVWFETEDSLPSVCEPANSIIEDEPDLSTPGLCGEGRSAWPLCELISDSLSTPLHSGSVPSILAPPVWPHGGPWDDVRVPTSCAVTKKERSKTQVHRGSLLISPSGLLHPETVPTMQKFFIHLGVKLQKVIHERHEKKRLSLILALI